jgi:hypothetical protein
MTSQFNFRKNKRIFLGEKSLASRQEVHEKGSRNRAVMRNMHRKSFVEENVLLGGQKNILQRDLAGKNPHADKSLHSSVKEVATVRNFQRMSSNAVGGPRFSLGTAPINFLSPHNASRQ